MIVILVAVVIAVAYVVLKFGLVRLIDKGFDAAQHKRAERENSENQGKTANLLEWHTNNQGKH
ncbi:MAG: hypothetical protein J5633_10380 [Oscillospiraceae bacterium]|nr:hypothetical protein [Oscillospiraceae bacterium]